MLLRRRLFAPVLALATLCACAIPAASFAETTASVSGTVTDESNAPLGGVYVTLRGASTVHTTTDAKGAFAFANVVPGIYVLTASRIGYTTAVQSDVSVLPGQSSTVSIRLAAATFSSLQTIASVRSTGRDALNTSPASVNVVTTQTFIDQGQPQVTRVLSQVPGEQISFPSNSANAAAPGAITVPNIRAATSYETASLIDGHPISVGQYGDNVTTFLNSFMFGDIEVVKGPGADAPVVNNAIGGTTNFRTKSPTAQPYSQLLFGVDNHGGTITNFDFRDTVGKFGFVIDLASNNEPSALNGKSVYYDPSGGTIGANALNSNSNRTQVGNTQSHLYTQPQLLACCYIFDGGLYQNAQLFKLQYKFSTATRMTVSFMGSQTTSDQNGNTANFIPSQFLPGAGYTGSLSPGNIMVASIYPGAAQNEFNNEPIFQAEASSTIGNTSILGRYYTATVSRYQHGGTDPTGIDFNTVRLYGTSSGGAGYVNQTFNGESALVGYSDYYIEPELDKLKGASLQLQRPLGQNGVLTLSADRTFAQSTDYSIAPGSNGPQTYYNNLFPGTSQILSTYLLRGQFFLGPKLNVTLSDYLNTYSSTYAINCPMDANGLCLPSADITGQGVTFQTSRNTHDDPRLGLVFRPSAGTSIRFAMGSSIAPPFLGLLNGILSTPSYDPSTGVAIESQSNKNLRPETGFGYDFGMDARIIDPQTVFSGDVYLTNLYNRFFAQTVNTGLTCAQVACSPNPTNVPPSSVPVLNQTNTNISNARFEGIELELRRQPPVGLGFDLSAALQKGYYYDLPPYFYCSLPGPGCTPNQNLNIIAGQNTNGIPVGFYNISYNGNMRIPYTQGNVELSYTMRNGVYVAVGDTYYGKNNSLNEPPFGIGYATLRVPVNRTMSLQVSGDNIFNAYSGFLPVWGTGVPIDLFGGKTAATNGNVLGPSTWRLMLTAKLP